MLRIGDIHLRTTEADRIIETIRGYIIANPEEQHIVFFGDYVYHVQYDRKMLLRLFHLFLELTSM